MFHNLTINRIIIHEVHRRDVNRNIVEPNYGQQLIHLENDAKSALQIRITEALGESSHGIEMQIQNTLNNSLWDLANQIIQTTGNDNAFINLSQTVTANLAEAQKSKGIPGGIVVVIEGTCGHPARNLMCVIKAEPHAGFIKRQEEGQLLLQYLKDLILTPQAKLYKIGAFIQANIDAAPSPENPSAQWKGFLFDDLATKGNRQGAAQYFYETFLGLAFPTDSAFQTKQFHTLTKDFIKRANIDEETRSDLLTALTTYLKVDNTATVQVSAFSEAYIPTAELQDAYRQHMVQNSFTLNAIHKDLTEVASALKQRKIVFGHNIKLTAPPETFEDFVNMSVIDGEPTADGQIPKWTQIIIRGRIMDQE